MDLQSRKINLINILLSIDNVQTIDRVEHLFLENILNVPAENQLEIQEQMVTRALASESDIKSGNIISHHELKKILLEG